MKLFSKIILSAALVLGTAITPYLQTKPNVDASAETGYTSASQVTYKKSGNYIYNWGARGEACTFLSPNALKFYTGNNTYEVFSQKSGSSSQSSVPSSDLYKTLQSFMKSEHSHITTYNETRDQYQYTDCLEGGGKISSFYSGTLIGPDWDGGNTWNREHTWPKSKSINQSKAEDSADLMTLRPTSTSENSSRGNTAYGESGSYYDPNDESGGKYNLHGDCARIVLYNDTRWGNTSYMWGSSGVMESLSVLLKWMEEDPVDTWEMGRNDSVEAITGTRNVFVDYPELAWLMFGRNIPNTVTTPSGIAKGMPSTPDTPVIPDDPVVPDEPDTPTVDANNAESILKAAYALGTNESLGTYSLTGKVTNIKEKDSSTRNICLTFVVDGYDEYPMYCYWLQQGYDLEVGDTITVSGEIKNYNGTVEFNKPSLISSSSGENSGSQTPDTPTNPDSEAGTILKNAYALGKNSALSGTHTLTGTVTNIKEKDSSTRNICLTFVVDGYDEYPMYCYWLQQGYDLEVGDTITVSGTIKNYNGTVEFDKPTLVSHVVGGTQTPDEPDTPTDPDEPTNPDTPTNPDEPTNPDTPTNPDAPTNPDDPTPPVGTTEPCKDGEHEYGEWVVTKEASETEFGKE